MPRRSARGMWSRSSTTAAATTGPASGPRPTSSMPQTRPPHSSSRARFGMARESHASRPAAISEMILPLSRLAFMDNFGGSDQDRRLQNTPGGLAHADALLQPRRLLDGVAYHARGD